MINWHEERATKNYCGYCNGFLPSSPCSGLCFTSVKDAQSNRVDHILTMLKKIPEEIEALQLKEQEYKDALSA